MGPRRWVAVRTLWNALRGGRRGAPGMGDRMSALPRLALHTLTGRYTGLSRGRLALMVAALVYIVSPVDALPEVFLAFAGLVDDAVVAAWLAGTVLYETEAFLAWEAGRRQVVTGEVLREG